MDTLKSWIFMPKNTIRLVFCYWVWVWVTECELALLNPDALWSRASSRNITYTKHHSAAKAARLNNKSLFVVYETYCGHLYQSAESGRLNQRGTQKCKCPLSSLPVYKRPSKSQASVIHPDESKKTSAWTRDPKRFCFALRVERDLWSHVGEGKAKRFQMVNGGIVWQVNLQPFTIKPSR